MTKSRPGSDKGRIRVNVPIDSPEYQSYLESLKESERLREENGGPTVEGTEKVKKAAQGVDELAIKTFKQERSN